MNNKNSLIKGSGLFLRGIEAGDIKNYYTWFNDSEVCYFNSHGVFPKSCAEMEKSYANIINTKNNLLLAIIVEGSFEHIGNVSLQNIDWISRTAEFAIIIGRKDYWGKNIGAQVAHLIIEHGFKNLNLNRIYCGTASNNVGMQRLAVKVGMIKEGIRRKAFYKNGKYWDIIDYGILKTEFEKANFNE